MGDFKHTFLIGDSSGKGALGVTEQLAFEEILRQGGTVNGDKGLVFPPA